MKNHIPLLLGLAFVSMHAADMPTKTVKPIRIKVYKKSYAELANNLNTVTNPDNFAYIHVTVNPLTTTLWDLQEKLRREIGPGDLSAGVSRLDLLLAMDPNILGRSIKDYLEETQTNNVNNYFAFWPLQ